MAYTILITGRALSAEATACAERAGARLVPTTPYATSDEIAAQVRAEQADAIIVRQGKVTEAVIDASPKLKVIAKHGVGYDTIDVDAAARRGIPVMVARGANSRSVAELAFALMFAVARDVAYLDARIRAGHWDKAAYTGEELFGRNLGIVGLGDIGRILAEMVQPLRIKVRVYDPCLPADARLDGIERVGSLDELLATSDIVSLHCPLTSQTRNMIGKEQLCRMRPNCILINTARGGLIDEQDLFEALRDKAIAGAGLDTFAQEPPAKDHPLLSLPNVVVTPHVGASTNAAKAAMGIIAVRHILDVLEGRPIDQRALVNEPLRKSA